MEHTPSVDLVERLDPPPLPGLIKTILQLVITIEI